MGLLLGALSPSRLLAQAPEPSEDPTSDATEQDTAPAPEASGAATEEPAPGGPAPASEAPSPSAPAAAEPQASFKPGRGLVVTSADGNYELGVVVRSQFLSIVEHGRDIDPRQTFQIRRLRLSSSGHIATPTLKYRMELGFGPREINTLNGVPQTSPLIDMVVDWQRFRDVNVRVGQFKVPLDRQHIMPFFRLHFIDRAITDAEFTFDRDAGVVLRSENLFGLDLLHYDVGIFTGDGRNSFQPSNFGLTYVARVEALPFGFFDDYSQGDFERSDFRLSVGAAYLLIDDAPRDRGILGAAPADGGTTDIQVATADLLVKYRGFTGLAAFFFRDSRRNPGPLVDDAGMPILGPDGAPLQIAPSRDGIGFLAEGGYLLPWWPLELGLRYAILDGARRPLRDALIRQEEFAGAVNYYFARHQLKLGVNYARLALDGDYAGSLGRLNTLLQAAF